MNETKVAASGEVQEGGLHAVKVGGHTVLLSRVDGRVCAFSAKCPHVGLSLARGKVDKGTVECAWHGSRFDLSSGQNLDCARSVAGCGIFRLALPPECRAAQSRRYGVRRYTEDSRSEAS